MRVRTPLQLAIHCLLFSIAGGQNGGQISSVRSKAYEKTDRFPDSDTLLTLNPFGGSYQSKNISNIFGPTHITLVRISIVKKIRDGCGFLRLPSSPTSPSASPAIMVPVKKLVGGGGVAKNKKEAGPAVYSGLYSSCRRWNHRCRQV